jgi:hypothetical protein
MVQGKYLDPITHEVIEDPVILCATGMVYGYKSLKQWVPTSTVSAYSCTSATAACAGMQIYSV